MVTGVVPSGLTYCASITIITIVSRYVLRRDEPVISFVEGSIDQMADSTRPPPGTVDTTGTEFGGAVDTVSYNVSLEYRVRLVTLLDI